MFWSFLNSVRYISVLQKLITRRQNKTPYKYNNHKTMYLTKAHSITNCSQIRRGIRYTYMPRPCESFSKSWPIGPRPLWAMDYPRNPSVLPSCLMHSSQVTTRSTITTFVYECEYLLKCDFGTYKNVILSESF